MTLCMCLIYEWSTLIDDVLDMHLKSQQTHTLQVVSDLLFLGSAHEETG